MSSKTVWGFVVTVLMVLLAVYVYNRFSGKNIADLGRVAA